MNTIQLLFDLDGTISDPIEGIWKSLNYGLMAFGFAPIGEAEARQFIGPPLDQTYITLTGNTDQSFIEEIVGKYRERFSQTGYAENSLYPDISETISRLAERGVSMAICTSKRSDFAEKILQMFHLRDYFTFISGGDVGVTKSMQIKRLLEKGRIDQSTLMIGDRRFDLAAAHENGLRSVGVLWGYGSREELDAQSPAFMLTEPSELLNLL